jgi:molybdopterin-guanine dinucleotide biosynthesis protein
MAHLRKRFITELFKETCRFSPIVGVLGHRQVGKTTFLEKNVENYKTFDNQSTFSLATQDAETFLNNLVTPPKTIASVQTFLKENPNAIALILHSESKCEILNRRTAILSLGSLF